MKRNFIAVITLLWAGLLTLVWGGNAAALDVNIAEDLPYLDTAHEGKVVRIERIQDENNVIVGGFSKTSRKCPPFCVQPIQVAPGVTTVGELEVLDFIKNKLNSGTGVLIDARTPSWHKNGTIPGSINIPFTTFDDDKSDLVKGVALGKLGVRKKEASFFNSLLEKALSIAGKPAGSAKWDFSEAKEILLWCNGMWCGQSPRAIHNLLKLGYPPEKIYYYRDGMQAWQLLGLTVVIPTDSDE